MRLQVIREFTIRVLVVSAISSGISSGNLSYNESYFKKYDICFKEEHPGAGDRFTMITPVMCSNPKLALGPQIELDFGHLAFKDINRDATPEVIVESSAWDCKMDGNCFFPYRVFLQLQFSRNNKKPYFKVIEQKSLEGLKAK